MYKKVKVWLQWLQIHFCYEHFAYKMLFKCFINIHWRSYNNFKEGEFVFYKHTSLPYAVHTFYRKCNKDIASCNCAVAVKVDDDVAIIDRCGPQSTKAFYSMSVKIIKNGNIDPAFRIFRYDQGNQYKVILFLIQCFQFLLIHCFMV